MLGVTEQDKGLFFLARVRTLLKRKDVYVGQLKKEIINCLNIETILPSMQQITLISSVLSLFLFLSLSPSIPPHFHYSLKVFSLPLTPK